MIRKEDPSQDRLRIDSIEAGGGVIGLTFCPGKHDVSASGRIWARDLKSDVEDMQRWGAQYVISILERDEFSLLNVPDLGGVCSRPRLKLATFTHCGPIYSVSHVHGEMGGPFNRSSTSLSRWR